MVNEIKLFELLKARMGEKEAEAFVEILEKKVDQKFEDAKQHLVTKEDLIKEISPVKAELLVIKWMLGFILAGILALIVKTFF